MKKYAVFAGLGDYYLPSVNGFDTLTYALNNIDQLMAKLSQSGWQNSLPMLDQMASVANIVNKLTEVINGCHADDWVLFYFVGHGAKYPMGPGGGPDKTFCVTYEADLRANNWPPLNNFFSEDNYEKIVDLFESKMTSGQLIAIFDCCYANGLLDAYDAQKDFQTVISSSAANDTTVYTDTSLFFKAYSQTWNSTFGHLQADINTIAEQQRLQLNCVVSPAAKFLNATL